MNRRLAADPLDVFGSALPAPGDGGRKRFAVEHASAAGIEGVGLGNAKGTAQVAARQIEQVRGNEFGLFAKFDPVAEQPGDRAGLALAALARRAIDAAAMFAEQAMAIVRRVPAQGRSAIGNP